MKHLFTGWLSGFRSDKSGQALVNDFGKFRNVVSLAFLLVLFFSVTAKINAQTNIANYSFAATTGNTYVPITGGTTVFSGAYDNSVSAAITMGGTFPFGGVNVTTCYISTNGFITFGVAPSSSTYAPLSTLESTTGAIAAFGQDAGASTVTGATPLISYLNTGAEFVVQYSDHANYYNRTSERLNFQIRLTYATGAINIVYGTNTNPGVVTSGTTPQVGIRGNSINYATNVNNLYALNVPSNTTCDWSKAVTGFSNASTLLFSGTDNVAVKIPAGLSYTWTPANQGPVRTFTAATGITTSSATVNWTAPTGATQYNVQYRLPGSCDWTDWSGNPVMTNSVTLTGLSELTSYQVRVQASNGAVSSIYSHIPNAAGTGNGYSATGSFKTLASCTVPTGIVVSNITPNSGTVAWTASNPIPSGGYEYELRTSGAAGSGATGLVSGGTTATLSQNFTGLTATTAYSFYVRSNCGFGAFSVWTTVSSFSTPCNAVALPTVLEGFNTAGIPSCWNTSVVTGTQSWIQISGSSGDITAPYAGAGFMEKDYTSSEALLVSMPISYTSVTAASRVNVFLHRHASADVGDQYVIYANTTPSLTGATQLLSVYSKTTIVPTVAATGWYNYLIDVPATFNGSSSVYIIIKGITSAGFSSYDLGVDNFKVEITPTDTVDLANLFSFNVNATQVSAIGTCQSVDVHAQAYEAGVTDPAGQAPGLVSWIGYSTTNTDPSTWPETAFTTATFTANVGNNDDFKVTLSNLPAGTYYFASRFQLNGGPFRYGASNNGFWNATTNPNAVLTVTAPVAIAAASSVSSICAGSTVTLTATSANANYTYAWSNAAGSGTSVVVSPTATTTYTVTATDTVTGCTVTATVSVVVNGIPTPIVVTPSSAELCTGTVQLLTASGAVPPAPTAIGNATTKTTETEELTAFCNRRPKLVYQTIYTAADLNAAGIAAGPILSIAYNITSVGSAANNTNFTVKIGTTTNAVFPNTNFVTTGLATVYGPATYTHAIGWNTITFTTPYVWDGISNIVVEVSQIGIDSLYNTETFYTQTTGNTVLYRYGIDAGAAVSASNKRFNVKFGYNAMSPITWSSTGTNDLFTDAAGTIPYVSGTPSISVYAKPTGSTTITANGMSTAGCSAVAGTAALTVTTTPAPTGESTQVISAVAPEDATVEDLVVVGTNVLWYASLADLQIGVNPLAPNAVLVNGAIYYATQTVNGCTSIQAFAVTVTVTLKTNSFDIKELKYYPNPVVSVLNVSYNSEITTVEVYNMIGQRVIAVAPNATTAAIDMSRLPSGTYIIQFKADQKIQTVKVVKK
ncbi:fibronectin type III domain-containing protein [Flavobacterium kingsejongi]|nr:fibronectin type III domain-containing protein [Flavobacterium kingsejongi]